jgi:hypothetical protein
MANIFKTNFRSFFLWLLPLFLLSNAEFENESIVRVPNDVGGFARDSFLKTKFDVDIETTYDGKMFSILKLHIENDNLASEHDMEFVISREKNLGGVRPGAYKIAKDKDGFLNHIDGVFGFLDSKNSGALPFFAHFGEITLAEVDEGAVNGYMNIHFKDTNGSSIHVKGDFAALPE